LEVPVARPFLEFPVARVSPKPRLPSVSANSGRPAFVENSYSDSLVTPVARCHLRFVLIPFRLRSPEAFRFSLRFPAGSGCPVPSESRCRCSFRFGCPSLPEPRPIPSEPRLPAVLLVSAPSLLKSRLPGPSPSRFESPCGCVLLSSRGRLLFSTVDGSLRSRFNPLRMLSYHAWLDAMHPLLRCSV